MRVIETNSQHVIKVDDMQNGYITLIDHVLKHGRSVSPRGQDTVEVSPLSVVLTRPQYATPVNVGRKINLALASAETTHLTAGISDAHQLCAIVPRFRDFVNGDRLLGAYGPRIHDQMPYVIKSLVEDSDTRRAIAMIWRPDQDNDDEIRDVPCTVSLGWTIRDGQLNAHTYMRSNDVFLGVPYDFTMFTRLQMTLAWVLGVGVGTYTHTAASMHIYVRDVEKLTGLTQTSKIVPSPVPPHGAPNGERTWDTGAYAGQKRELFTALSRWRRVLTWSKDAMLPTPNKPLPETTVNGSRWHRNILKPYLTDNLYCSLCHYALPRTVENFWAHNRDNKWKGRCRKCINEQQFQPPEVELPKRLEKRCNRYGTTSEWYYKQLELQQHVCAICHTTPDNGRYREFVIDHDHVSGRVRGLLCSSCNHALGLLNDDQERISRMITYLRNSSE